MPSHRHARPHAGQFREAVLRVVAEGGTRPADPAGTPSPSQLAEAEHALGTGGTLDLGDGHRAEPRSGGWVVVDRLGSDLVEVEARVWSAAADGRTRPPLVFTTPGEALAAFLRAASFARARAAWYEEEAPA
jgi:hypothetical protein